MYMNMMLKRVILDMAEGMRQGTNTQSCILLAINCGAPFNDQFHNEDAVIQLSVIHEK
jgi:hypothetical protein